LGAATAIPLAAGLVITASIGLSELAAPAWIAASGLALGFVIVSGNIALALGTAPHERTIGVAAILFTSRIAAFVIPILIGFMLDTVGFSATFVGAAVLGALLLLLLLIRIARGTFASAVGSIDGGSVG
jgi:fucose permease